MIVADFATYPCTCGQPESAIDGAKRIAGETLHGRSVVVTGSTSGIGLAIARAFGARVASVTLNGFGDEDVIEQDPRGIEELFGVTAMYSNADMTKPDEIDTAICSRAG